MDLLARLGLSHVAATVLAVAAVCAGGLLVGQLKIRGHALGVVVVLFVGLLAGHLGIHVDGDALALVRDLGLLFFVAAIGAQLGPGFVESLRHGGLALNALAAAVVGGGVLVAAAWKIALSLDVAAAVGVLAGATTNTPSLGAATEALRALALEDARRGLAGLGYAVAYPFGVGGIIAALVILRVVFRVDPKAEADALLAARARAHPPLERQALVVENANLEGLPVRDIPGLAEHAAVVSRVKRKDAELVEVAHPDTVLHQGDVILGIGTADGLNALRIVVGRAVDVDLLQAPGGVAFRRVVVTSRDVVGARLAEAELALGGSLTITRHRRGEVELTARPDHHLRFGDILHLVGREDDLTRASTYFGNSDRALTHAELLPLFVVLALGLLVGALALPVQGLPAPLTLGLAGGPLVVAIALARIGRVGPVVFYLPGNVNAALRELGMALFLAAVGLKAGAHVGEAASGGAGPLWIAVGLTITLVPMLVVGVVGRLALKLDYPTLSGVLAGAMTDPPALAFAEGLAGSDAPAVGYAAVYPLTMILRIVSVQVLVMLLGP